MKRVFLALDKFKDAITAEEACAVVARVLAKAKPAWRIDCCPFTDGGEGFTRILTEAAGGNLRTARVQGPRGKKVVATFGLVSCASVPAPARRLLNFPARPLRDRIAIVELAQASGLGLLAQSSRNPMLTSTEGVGQLLSAVVRAGARGIVLGVGGSATNDLGLGALSALGLKFLDGNGRPCPSLAPKYWIKIAGIEGKVRNDLPPICIACDVANPLLGANGAAAIYGPQKGLNSYDRASLENQSARMAGLLSSHFQRPPSLAKQPGTGAAGGIAFGLMCATGAQLVVGSALVSSWLNLGARLKRADIVVTGEGRFGPDSFSGKGPGVIAKQALKWGKRVHVFCGTSGDIGKRAGLFVHEITPLHTPLAVALQRCPANLAKATERIFTS